VAGPLYILLAVCEDPNVSTSSSVLATVHLLNLGHTTW
jgi:hypothetical protein